MLGYVSVSHIYDLHIWSESSSSQRFLQIREQKIVTEDYTYGGYSALYNTSKLNS